MAEVCQQFVKQKAQRHHSVHLSQRKVQLKHPIFRLLTINAFKYIIDRAYLFKLKAGQTAYKHNRRAMNNVYFVLYGEFDYMKDDVEQFGERCGLGWPIGEEILFHKDAEGGPLKRMETVV